MEQEKTQSNIRHSSRLAALSGQKRSVFEGSSSPVSPKRRKSETTSNPCVLASRKQICMKKINKLKKLKQRHEEHITEEFFLNNRGVLLDYSNWRANPPANFKSHLNTAELYFGDLIDQLNALPDSPPPQSDSTRDLDDSFRGTIRTILDTPSPVSPASQKSQPQVEFGASLIAEDVKPKDIHFPLSQQITPEKSSTRLNSADISSTSGFEKVNFNESLNSSQSDIRSFASADSQSGIATPVGHPQVSHDSTIYGASTHASYKSPSLIALNASRQTYSEGSIERAAKQEAHVLRRIAELRREGLWSAKKMPKCLEPPRNKTQWDYLLEEMQWMAIDFEQERKWKRSAAKKFASAIARQKRELDDRERKQDLEKEKELKRIASFTAREIKQFWNNIEKVVEYKTENIVEAKKKRALDKHLDFIVGQTEKYSSLIQEGLNKPYSPSPVPSAANDDLEFEAEENSDDDETTIAKAEEHENRNEVEDEVALLQKEADIDIDNIIDSLPAGYVENYGLRQFSRRKSSSEVASSVEMNSDDDEEDASDAACSSKSSAQACTSSRDSIDFKKLKSSNSEERQQELNHIAETAEKFLPKGFTLDSVNIVTKQPFLLKHNLREYQRVGLDWLVTLYEKKLNGILADEMGLGKTIQTIALLAYLACEKRNWGPHLIVVPTTVLLNWEMECKKWCPAFKVLTYYGSLKERKEKRKGWSKTNSFHICITSYKLVLQDNLVFRRKNWQYLILDEAQNIKNFKSQRWQMLLSFKTERRLLLTGTPLQNSLMELWSLMHFLMPHVFGSHKDFRDWFSNPLTGMIEGTQEFNEQTVKRLHKVLRPFLLRRLKADVERQLPKKYEHLIVCPLSKRQRYLYDDFMSKGSTKNQLASGNVMSVMNILMQLRKVCNHPFLFEPRPIVSPFVMRPIEYKISGKVCDLIDYDALNCARLPNLMNNEFCDTIRALRLVELSEGFPRHNVDEVVEVPKIAGFIFKPSEDFSAKQSLAYKQAHSPDNGVKRLQFVIPSQVAQSMNLREPFFLQMVTPSGQKYIPVMLNNLPNDINEVTGINVMLDVPKTPPVLRLVPQSGSKSSGLQAIPVAGHFYSSTLSPGAKYPSSNMGQPSIANSASAVRPAGSSSRNSPVTVSALGAVIMAKTMITPKPKISLAVDSSFSRATHTITSINTGSSVFPQITVQDVLPKSPSICVFDPNKVKMLVDTLRSPAAITPSTTNVLGSQTKIETDDEMNILSIPPHLSAEFESVTNLAAANKISRSSFDTNNYEKALAAFHIMALRQKRIERRLNCCMRLINENRRRCRELPIYGENLRKLCNVRPSVSVEVLVTDWEQRLILLKPLLDRFTITIPNAKTSSSIRLRASQRHKFAENAEENLINACYQQILPHLAPLASILVSQSIQFPELRLIEYDCGKLQSLASLLRQLKLNGSRCLIFTQMTRMLDILEAFLCYHGYTYLRLDGATRIEHRQILMERFNQDTRIFCFILSTRSGGIGVNLTGANAVIFYDSDWNPTMDAQAQDRCHRIGQTRDVHIYRLISEKTVEENILKKAVQKRRLGEIAIEEGGFTSDFFKKTNILDIFELVEADVTKVKGVSQQELEQAMAKVEDERDVVAAKIAGAEAVAELAEFDENQNFAETEELDPDVVKVEQEMKHLMDQLKPVERYAVKYLEALVEPDRLNEVRQTEEEIESHKRRWEEAQELARKEEMKQKREIEDEEFELTYQRADSLAQMVSSVDQMDVMFTWCPPTPPLSDSEEFDPYYEPSLGFLYDRKPIPECDLPPLYVDQGPLDSPKTADSFLINDLISDSAQTTPVLSAQAPQEIRVPQSAPKSLQQQQPSEVQQPQQHKQQHLQQPRDIFASHLASKLKQTPRRQSTPPPGTTDNDATEVLYEWNIAEDFALLNAVTKVQQTSYSLCTANIGHGVNWDLVSECVTQACDRYRSPRQCHKRYETTIMPREEGRPALLEGVSKKSRKAGAPDHDIKTKKFRVRTSSQFQIEGQHFMTNFVGRRFHAVANLCSKRSGLTKRAGYGIYDDPSEKGDEKRGGRSKSFAFIPQTASTPSKLVDLYEEKIRLREMEEKRKLHLQQQMASSSTGRPVAARSLLQTQQHPHASFPSSVSTVGGPQRFVTTISNFPALITRPSTVLPINVSTAAVYRQVGGQQNFRLQRTPPGTPGPAITVQTTGSTAYQITSCGVSRSVDSSLLGTVVVQTQTQTPQVISQPPSDFTALIKQPQSMTTTSLRLHNFAGSGRQKIQVNPQSSQQYGGGSFLVSAEVSKPSISGHQLATILQPGGRLSTTPIRTQLQLSTGATTPHFRKHSPIPRLSALQGGLRSSGMGSVHLISPSGRLCTPGSSPVLSRTQPSSVAHQLLASSSSTQPSSNRTSIPSVSNILPSSGNRLEALTVGPGPTIIIQQHHQYPASSSQP